MAEHFIGEILSEMDLNPDELRKVTSLDADRPMEQLILFTSNLMPPPPSSVKNQSECQQQLSKEFIDSVVQLLHAALIADFMIFAFRTGTGDSQLYQLKFVDQSNNSPGFVVIKSYLLDEIIAKWPQLGRNLRIIIGDDESSAAAIDRESVWIRFFVGLFNWFGLYM